MKEHFSNSDIKGESTKNLGNINQTFRQRIYNNLKILLLQFDLFHLDYIWFMNAALSAIRVPLTLFGKGGGEGGHFYPLALVWCQILLAEFFSKISKLFGGEN